MVTIGLQQCLWLRMILKTGTRDEIAEIIISLYLFPPLLFTRFLLDMSTPTNPVKKVAFQV
jgi:hypothetical protein